jgi:GDP-L-fucose synthase
MEKSSRIFVAGHRGMVGSAILRHLEQEGYTAIITASKAECDLREQASVREFFQKHSPEYVFIAAAKVGGIIANNTYRAEFLYDNLMIAANVIEASYRAGVKKLVNLGSSCIYPKFAEQPITEESLLTGILEPTNEPYAIAKIAAVKLCSSYNYQYGTEFLSLMPTNLYGPNDNFNLETSHVLPALIRKFTLAKLLADNNYTAIERNLTETTLSFGWDTTLSYNNDTILKALQHFGIEKDNVTLWGSGNVYREFLHADDVANSALYFMNSITAEQAGEVVNIGTGKDITIRTLAQMIATAVGYTGSITFDTTKPDGTPRKLLNVSRATELGWNASITIEQGIERVAGDYAQRYMK